MRSALLKRKMLNAGALWVSYVKLIPWLFRLNKESVVIDCGANVGSISYYLSITGATIYAFEPDPVAFKALLERCGNKKNIQCINKGVWCKNAWIKLYRHRQMLEETDFTVSSSIVSEKRNISSGSSIEVEVVDLIEFIRSLNKKVDLVKIDIEGAEIEILEKIISTDSYVLFKVAFIETHESKIPGQKEQIQAIKQLMAKKGINNIKLNWI